MQGKIDNRRIMKNSVILYLRMFFLLVLGLYTGRLVLKMLGVEDYGVYNIAGGIITVIYTVTTSMTASSLRFIQVELGRGDEESQKKVFGNILFLHGILGLFILLLGESVGLWFLLEKVVIPDERSVAAFWVYQFSVISSVITISSAPYNALIISHEKMSAFAYISFFDAVFKLAIIYLVAISPYDKLIFYAFLILAGQIIDRAIYYVYCKRKFTEGSCRISSDKVYLKQMLAFTGWQSINDIAYMMNTQGVNIILNLFFGPIVNAARGVAVMVEGQVYSFYYNVQQAFVPQTVKLYAEGELEAAKILFVRNSKFSYFVLLIVALPVIMEIDVFLNWWLVEVPPYSISFVILILLTHFFSVLQRPLYTIASAKGDIKTYMVTGAIALLLVLPVSYILLKKYQDPLIPFVALLFFQAVALVVRVKIALPMVNTSFKEYIKDVILPLLAVTVLASIVPFLFKGVAMPQVLSLVIVCSSAVIMVAICAYYFGCTRNERAFIANIAGQFVNKFQKRNG